jgi:hypothetical protein
MERAHAVFIREWLADQGDTRRPSPLPCRISLIQATDIVLLRLLASHLAGLLTSLAILLF